ncbi:MAG: DUF692 domain-containing protein [Phycisphaerae bacterium]|jgi:uncharacterized protein (UPF0276 family)|nr:DUF692 domain-containing protein [Phycisphaerae bacterium]
MSRSRPERPVPHEFNVPGPWSLGLGIGWRRDIALFIDRRDDLGFLEVMAEDIDPDAPLSPPIRRLVERGLVAIPHGVTLSLGGAERPDPKRLDRLARVAQRLGAPLVSEHIAFVRSDGLESGHLLPVPRTREALEILVENVRDAQARLPVPLALENIATLFEPPDAEMDEPAFIGELLERTGALLLLDIANVHANAVNHGFNAAGYLDRMPLERIAYVHVAGGSEHHGVYHDTHVHPIQPPVLDLLSELCRRVEVPGILWEHDDCFGPDADMSEELGRIQRAIERGRTDREHRDANR